MTDPRRILVVGEPRSGTTLLRELLVAQPTVGRSGLASQRPLELLGQLGLGVHDPLSPRQLHILAQSGGLERGEIDATPTTFARWHREMSTAHAPGEVDAVVDRVHRPLRLAGQLLDAPDTAIVFLVRDVRDVVLSRAYQYAHEQTELTVLAWRRALRDAAKLTGHPRFAQLRFEDLIREPARSAARLGEALGLSVTHTRLGEAGGFVENSTFGDVVRPFDPASVERWRGRPDDPRVRFAGWAARRRLRWLGYPEPARLGMRERARFAHRRGVARGLDVASRARRRLTAALLPPLD